MFQIVNQKKIMKILYSICSSLNPSISALLSISINWHQAETFSILITLEQEHCKYVLLEIFHVRLPFLLKDKVFE